MWQNREIRLATTILFHLRLNDDSDVGLACQRAREAGRGGGLALAEVEALATAVSEVARNVVVHAGRGELVLESTDDTARRALIITIRDQGPGIADVDAALRDGYTTGHGLGLGLPSARRLVDALELHSEPGVGTTVTLKKWLPLAPRRRG